MNELNLAKESAKELSNEMDFAYAKIIKGLLILNGYSENQMIDYLKSYALDDVSIEKFKNVSFDDNNPYYNEKLKSNNYVEEKMKEIGIL